MPSTSSSESITRRPSATWRIRSLAGLSGWTRQVPSVGAVVGDSLAVCALFWYKLVSSLVVKTREDTWDIVRVGELTLCRTAIPGGDVVSGDGNPEGVLWLRDVHLAFDAGEETFDVRVVAGNVVMCVVDRAGRRVFARPLSGGRSLPEGARDPPFRRGGRLRTLLHRCTAGVPCRTCA